MSHLFKKTEYLDFTTKYCSQIKKSLELHIEQVVETLNDNLHPI